jgi:hypothetical protein
MIEGREHTPVSQDLLVALLSIAQPAAYQSIEAASRAQRLSSELVYRLRIGYNPYLPAVVARHADAALAARVRELDQSHRLLRLSLQHST